MPREPWVCPECGRRLHVPNQEHACGHYDLESHFEGKDPIGRIALDWLLAAVEPLGPVEILPMKTMIGFQARSNFAFLQTKRKGVELSLVLADPAPHPLLKRIDPYGPNKRFHRFRIVHPADLDGPLADLLNKAFRANA